MFKLCYKTTIKGGKQGSWGHLEGLMEQVWEPFSNSGER